MKRLLHTAALPPHCYGARGLAPRRRVALGAAPVRWLSTRPVEAARRLLGVAVGCSEVELKASYRKLAMRWHPDRQVWWGSVALSLQK